MRHITVQIVNAGDNRHREDVQGRNVVSCNPDTPAVVTGRVEGDTVIVNVLGIPGKPLPRTVDVWLDWEN